MKEAKQLVVSEVFGPTFQGEGPTAGRRCAFVRLGRCNLDCAWCDTPYTWDWKGANGTAYDPAVELSTCTVEQVLDQLEPMRVDRVVVSGGEPLLQATALLELVEQAAWEYEMVVEVETNGTRHPGPLLDKVRWNVSPKLAHSGVPRHRRVVPEVLRAFAHHPGAAYKVVVQGPEDLPEVDSLMAEADAAPAQVWVMPEGRDAATVLERARALAPGVLARGWNLSLRHQVLLYGDERGK